MSMAECVLVPWLIIDAVIAATPALSALSNVAPALTTRFIDTIGNPGLLTTQTSRPFESFVFSIAGKLNFGSGPAFGSIASCLAIRASFFFFDSVDAGLSACAGAAGVLLGTKLITR